MSHDEQLLSNLPREPFLTPVPLRKLGIEERLRGEDLAESRFLVSGLLGKSDRGAVGFVSARWNERFPKWPGLSNLDRTFEHLITNPNYFAAPQAVRVSGRNVKAWIHAQDAVHPGMSNILNELALKMSLDLNSPGTRTIVMGNNFVLSRKVAKCFSDYWLRAFQIIDNEYGLDLPFSYRCPRCGMRDPEGVGRWSKLRHAGFFYERVSALFFASNAELIPLDFRYSQPRKLRKTIISNFFELGPKIYLTFWKFWGMGRKCNHTYKPIGIRKP